MRLPTLLVAFALSASLLAGCTSPDEGPSDDATPAPGPGSGQSSGTAGSGSAGHVQAAAPVEDAGDVAGPFQKSWPLEVHSVAFREARVQFSLAGVQAGAPPTARVEFSLLDPDGKVVKTQLVGLGGDGDALEWTLRAADLPGAGTYTLRAVNGADADPTSLAAPGLAKYTLHAEVFY